MSTGRIKMVQCPKGFGSSNDEGGNDVFVLYHFKDAKLQN